MKSLPTGIVLPQDVLTQPWFGVFTLFVALNTIIYLGLTVAKFVPWPAQVRPSQVRQFVPHTEEVAAMQESYRSAFRELDRPAQDLRDTAACQTIPIALALVGALTTVIGLLYVLLYFDTSGPLLLVGPIFGFVLVVLSLLLARSRASATVMRWAWVLLMLAFIAENSWRAAFLDSAVPLAYALITLGFAAAITLSWPAGIAAAGIGTIPIIIGGYAVSVVDTVSWAFASLAAALASLVVLYLRLSSLDRLAQERARANAMATTDPRTGLLSRTGLISLAPAVAEATGRAHESIAIVALELPELSTLNADYGFDYGGEVLGATGRAFRASLPQSALVARWSGGTFLALVAGTPPSAEELRHAVDERLGQSGIALGKRPIRTSVGVASGSPLSTTLESLVAEAEVAAAAG